MAAADEDDIQYRARLNAIARLLMVAEFETLFHLLFESAAAAAALREKQTTESST